MDYSEIQIRKKNPRETANILSKITFVYIIGLFKKSFKKDLEDSDLFEVPKQLNSKKCGDDFESLLDDSQTKNQNTSLYALLLKKYGLRFFGIGLVQLTRKLLSSILYPWAVSNLVSYFTPGQTTITKTDAYLYATWMLITLLLGTLCLHNYNLWTVLLGMEIKTSVSSLLYRKSLQLTDSSVALGNIVIRITKDVLQLESGILALSDTWIGIVQVITISCMLYIKIGATCFYGVGVLLLVIPIQVLIGKYASQLRLKAGTKSDERVQVTQETLSSIRIIKMYTWEKFFEDKIEAKRSSEMFTMMLVFCLRILIVVCGVLFTKVSLYVLIIAYVWSGGTADAETIFYIVSIFGQLKEAIGVYIPYGIGAMAEFYSAITRINNVLNAEELLPNYAQTVTDHSCVELNNVVYEIKERIILKDVSIEFNPGLTIIMGSVGSGKSALLKTILEECPLTSGSVNVQGSMSYASQDPWLFPSSIRQNILFGQAYDENKYKEVLKICALDYDLRTFEKGDQTIITDSGLNLSKGQQIRINLARAIYKDSDIYLLDDSLSSLNQEVRDFIFQECIRKYLKDKLCLLVTNSAKFLEQADNILVMDKGEVVHFGPPNELAQDDDLIKNIAGFLTDGGGDSKYDSREDIKDRFPQFYSFESSESQDVIDKSIVENNSEKKQVYSEVKNDGQVPFSYYKRYFMFGGVFILLLNILLFGASQVSDSYSDQLLSKWVDQEHDLLTLRKNCTDSTVVSTFGTTLNILSVLPKFVQPSTTVSPDSCLEESIADAEAKEKWTIKLYFILIFVSTSLTLLKTYFVFFYCRRASVNTHKAMVRGIMNAAVSFFDIHFIGNILNRFSQDLNNIDELLPSVINQLLMVTFAITGIIYNVATVNIQFLVHAAIFVVIIYILKIIYLPTGRSLQRLDAATRSPMIGHLNSTVDGLTTIRAYGAQQTLIEEFDKHQNIFTSAHYTAACSSRAFGFFIDLFCTVFIGSIIFRFLIVDTGTSAGNVGLALTQISILAGYVQWGVRQWADLENLMTSVERTLEYTVIKPEKTEGEQRKNWPVQGSIQYQNVSLCYKENQTSLTDITFPVKPKEIFGIIGRTGAGKSSIISVLFRLYDFEGTILIDEININTIAIKYLRKSIGIIPQNPVLFSGTIRTNLDPFQEYSDKVLWDTINKVGLTNVVPSLETSITSNHDFSAGQKQLVCLARVLLRNVKIVVLDEATSSLDFKTAQLVYKIIKDHFSNCTILLITHNLHTLQFDNKIILNKGKII